MAGEDGVGVCVDEIRVWICLDVLAQPFLRDGLWLAHRGHGRIVVDCGVVAVARRGEPSARAYARTCARDIGPGWPGGEGRAGRYQTLQRSGSQLPVLSWLEWWA